MERNIKIFMVVVGVALFFVGCENSFLDSTPNDMLSENEVYSNQSAFKAHMAHLYSQMPFPDRFENVSISFNTGEMVNETNDQNSSIPVDHWWTDGYSLIRALNQTIKNLPDATAFSDDTEKTKALGEVKFLRAYAYYSLVRRYGGIPIILEAKELPSGDISKLYQARDNEADVFKFIEKEMTDAVGMIPDVSGNPDVYRINKWSALAFKSEAMLTAASIAKYGEVQLDGIDGIPQTEANHYWKSARDAAKKVIDSGKYELYNQDENKALNYHDLFFDESDANKERIFVKAYTWPQHGHDFDRAAAPFSHRSAHGYGGRRDPTFDMAENYEYINNRDGSLKLTNDDGSPIVYKDPTNLFENKDPRFFASVLFPGSPWKGSTLEIYANVIEGGVKKGGHGADGIAQPEATATGLYMSKWEERTTPRPITGNSSDVDFISMRYAEVLLNYAEAELELNDEPEARKYVNMIRSRAGIQKLTNSMTMEDYRHERNIELAYEGNRYWDMKRWRIFDKVIHNRNIYALWPTYNIDKDEYTFSKHKLPSGKYTLNFPSYMYYYGIPSGIIQNNPDLVQNPGY